MAVGASTYNNANYLTRSTGLPTFNSSTICGYYYHATTNVGSGIYGSVGAYMSASGYAWMGLNSGTDDVVMWTSTGGFSATVATLTVGNWYYFVITVNGTSLTGYVALVGNAITTGAATTVSAGVVGTEIRLLQDGSGLDPGGGFMAFVRAWSSVLSVAEMNAERLSTVAVKVGSTFDAPLTNTSTIDGFSIVGTLSSMTSPSNPPNAPGLVLPVGSLAWGFGF